MIYLFDQYSLDCERRELRRGHELVSVEPQVFDLLQHLVRHRQRVVDKDELIAEVWRGRIVSESTLSSRIAAVRQAIGDSGAQQRLVRTLARKGFRFVADVKERVGVAEEAIEVLSSPQPYEAASRSAPEIRVPQRRQLTVLVCGILDPSTLLSPIDPEDLRRSADPIRAAIRSIVEGHGGYVVRSSEDSVVAYFGYPQAHEDDAERAVKTGLDVVKIAVSGQLSGVSPAPHGRVGIATGLVLVGSQSADEGSVVTGETPHVAARLQSMANVGEVLISASTKNLVGNLFVYREGTAGRSSGDEGAIANATAVVGESGITSRFDALRPNRHRLIGRDEERNLLLDRWAHAKAGEGRAVLVWGEPGIGKSRLVAALEDSLQNERHTCLRYFCSPHRMQTALHPVITQLEHAAGFVAGDDDRARLDKMERLLALSSRQPQIDRALFAELLSLPVERYAPLSLSSVRRKELLFESFIAQLASLATRKPVLIVLEDLHWIDPTTRELFDIIVERIRHMSVLLIMTYRPEFVAPWLGQSHVTTLTLNRLGPRENATLVTQVAGGKDLPSRLLDQIVARTDGVPLFIEEVTKTLLESGVLREDGGRYVLDGSVPIDAVPESLQASLIARLDRIAPARAVVQTSAALGREFRYDVLKGVMALPDADLGALLDQLVRAELVHQRGEAPHATYTFKHALVQDAAYETMPKVERPAIHRRIVEVIEGQFPDIAEHHPDVLAYHCTEAALPEKAVDCWIRAARIALARSAGVEAHGQVETAMSLLPRIESQERRRQMEGRLQVAQGDALIMTKGFASPEVKIALSKARELLDEKAHPIEALVALGGLFNYHLIRSESPACLELAEGRLQGKLARPTATVVHYLVGTAHLHLGNFSQSIGHLDKALSLYDEEICRPVGFLAGIHVRSFILIWLGLGYLFAGSLKLAADTIAAAVADARERSHPFTLVSALLALARFRNHVRDLDGAIAATEEGMAIATEQRSPYHVSRAAILRAINIVDGGRPEEGIVLMEHALATHRATGANFQSAYNLSRLAEAHARAGHIALANEFAMAAVAEVERTGERWWEAEAQRIRGEILLRSRRAKHGEAEACFSRALQCAQRQRARLWELHASLSLAGLWQSEGKDQKAKSLLRIACSAFDDGYDIEALGMARDLLGKARPSTAAGRSTSDRRSRI